MDHHPIQVRGRLPDSIRQQKNVFQRIQVMRESFKKFTIE